MADDFWSGLLQMIGPLLQTAGGVYSAGQEANLARRAETEREQQYQQLQKATDPKNLMARIMSLKQSLSEEEKKQIIRSITAAMNARGAGGATGILQEAIAEALAKADIPLFEQAQNAALGSLKLPLAALPAQPAASRTPNIGNPFQSLINTFLSKKPATSAAPSTSSPGDLPDLPTTGASPWDMSGSGDYAGA